MIGTRIIQPLGQQTVRFVRDLLGLRALFWRTVASYLRHRWSRREALQQTFEYTNRSMLFVVVTLGFVGMIMVYQGCTQAGRLLGDMSLIGPGFLQLVIREFGPTVGGLMLATRVGAGIAAEIGSMTVTEQVDALRMSGADPIDYLVTPRVVAGIISAVACCVFGAVVMYLVGGFTARIAFNVPLHTYFSLRMVRRLDVVSFVHKAVTYGTLIPLVSARAGFEARGGSEGVGSATTRAVIESSLGILFFDLVIGAFYFLLGKLI
jgi:phospholipid/cholesterol/gamma-HCH transport system permease protein